ncbi:MAG: integrase arm-type DNA-binding domain-containing protein, partial [Candidatus Methylomirabilis sp.]|nr:integrase arm-type DNA-binding domain-containing protein [Deltaproteobacteria bacterium]
MARIGVRTVESAKAVPGRDVFVWDDELKGFGVRVKPSGAKSYVLQYRNAYRRSRRITLADCAKLAPEKARKRALKLLGGIAEGADPAEDRKNALAACTVAEFAERYYAEHCLKTKKRSTHASDRSILSKHVLPAIGHKPLNQVDKLDVLKIRGALADKPIVFNRVRTFLSAMFNTAEAWGLRPEGSNPACGVKKHREERRERFLSPRAIVRLGEALAELEREGTIRPAAAAFVRLALTTGMRSSEVRGLRWEDIRPDQNAILLRDSKTGARALPLTPAVAEILGAIPRDSGGPWVIAGRIRGEPMVNPARPWAALCKRAAAI